MDTATLLDEIAKGNVIALIPAPRPPTDVGRTTGTVKRWYTMAEVGEMLGFGVSKVKDLVIRREIRSVKVGKYRRILPEWVDEYVAERAQEVNR